jgi:hypothetical protein
VSLAERSSSGQICDRYVVHSGTDDGAMLTRIMETIATRMTPTTVVRDLALGRNLAGVRHHAGDVGDEVGFLDAALDRVGLGDRAQKPIAHHLTIDATEPKLFAKRDDVQALV